MVCISKNSSFVKTKRFTKEKLYPVWFVFRINSTESSPVSWVEVLVLRIQRQVQRPTERESVAEGDAEVVVVPVCSLRDTR